MVATSPFVDDATAGLTVAVTLSERARQREIASYLAAACITPSTAQLEGDGLPEPPVRSPDTNFTALVQLGAYRLDCQRSFFSLIDGKNQYIVAEATKFTPLNAGQDVAAQSDLLLGTMLMDKNWGVCPRTVEFFTNDDMVCHDPNIIASKSRYIIKDFLADEGFRSRPYVAGWPHFRSYAEVPIISPSGYVLGGYCVVDDKPRVFSDAEIDVLADVGRTIMSHLEHVRMKNHQARSEILVRGLDKFIQEEASYSTSRRDSAATSSTLNGQNDVHVLETAADDTVDPILGVSHQPDTSSPVNGGTEQSSLKQDLLTRPGKRTGSVKESALPAEIRRAFKRSGKLIRESLGMDGLVFLDASPLGIDRRVRIPDMDSEDMAFGPSSVESAATNNACPVIASSFTDKGESYGDVLPFSGRLLDQIIRRFPRGQLFSADEFGAIVNYGLPSYSELVQNASREDIDELFRHIPNARSAIFIPLWHFQKERWFAAAIGWTCNPMHSFDAGDATYLSAFGNSIMVEVLKYEALAVSKAKSDFISSISHEIRSPLHGILATTELLTETVTAAEDRAMLDMIQSCGTTLLDTMNHLLEFAKINSLSQSRNKSSAKAASGSDLMDLGRLVEDVTESVTAGHAFETNPYKQSGRTDSPARQNLVPDKVPGLPVLVVLDMHPTDGWIFHSDIGAWKRIVMNLIGNALKYTPSGQITVKLEIKNGNICFSVRDTGVGISDEYLKYRLFTPFAQENTFSSGTGLGLCIVQQIVHDLGGKLNVESEVGVGTRVSVSVPIPEDPGHIPAANTEDEFAFLKGKRLCFLPSDKSLHREGWHTEHDVYEEALQATVVDISTTWLGMQVIQSRKDEIADADLYIVDASWAAVPLSAVPKALANKPVAVITNIRSRHQGRGQLMKCIRAPIGPRQLAALLSNLLRSTANTVPSADLHPVHVETQQGVSILLRHDDHVHEPIRPALPPTPPKSDQDIPVTVGAEAVPVAKPKPASHHHILVVDDNNINLKILSKLLHGLGCTYATATNGLEAVHLYKAPRTKPFSLVFMDVSMPVMNGFQATQEIRDHESEAGIHPVKVIALTGLGDEGSEREAYACGMDEFWTKPVGLGKVKKLLLAKT